MGSPEALIHGDLHTGSIMVTESETLVIDPEFAFYGPMGFDLGAVLGNLVMGYLASNGHERSPGERRAFEAWMLETIENVWTEFSRKFVELWRTEANGDAYPATLFSGQAGAARPRGRAAGLHGAAVPRHRRILPRRRSFAASSVSRTISISNGSKIPGFGRSARREACVSPAR